MPTKICIKVKFEKPILGKKLTPDKVHGLFFSLIGERLSERLHQEYRDIKPYTLYCKEIFKKDETEELTIEVNLLEDSLLTTLLSGLLLGKKEAVLYMEEPIKGDFSIKALQKWIKSYETLVKEVKVETKIGIKFIAPTTFRRNDIDFPFPIPELIFKGLVKKWLKFSKVSIDIDLRKFYDQIKVEKYKLKTGKVRFSNGGKLTVFQGYTIYNLSGINKEALRWFNILLSYTTWALVGRKTTMGLGKVRIFRGI